MSRVSGPGRTPLLNPAHISERNSPMPNDTTKAAPDERGVLKPYTRRILDALA